MKLSDLEMCDSHEVVSTSGGYKCVACDLRGTLFDLFDGPLRCNPHGVFENSGWSTIKNPFPFI